MPYLLSNQPFIYRNVSINFLLFPTGCYCSPFSLFVAFCFCQIEVKSMLYFKIIQNFVFFFFSSVLSPPSLYFFIVPLLKKKHRLKKFLENLEVGALLLVIYTKQILCGTIKRYNKREKEAQVLVGDKMLSQKLLHSSLFSKAIVKDLCQLRMIYFLFH